MFGEFSLLLSLLLFSPEPPPLFNKNDATRLANPRQNSASAVISTALHGKNASVIKIIKKIIIVVKIKKVVWNESVDYGFCSKACVYVISF